MEHSADPDDVSGITWPGFVDIMSSVIMMFIFFVLVTSVALYFHTITYKSKILGQIQQMVDIKTIESTQTLTAENEEIKKQLQELKTENEILTASGPKPDKNVSEADAKEAAKATAAEMAAASAAAETIVELKEENKTLSAKVSEYEEELRKIDAQFSVSKDQKIITDSAENSIVVFFGKDSISLTEESNQTLAAFFEASIAKFGTPTNIKVSISGGKNPNAPTASIARELALARMLNSRNILLKTTIPKQNISAQMVNDEKIEDTYNWVKISLDKK